MQRLRSFFGFTLLLVACGDDTDSKAPDTGSPTTETGEPGDTADPGTDTDTDETATPEPITLGGILSADDNTSVPTQDITVGLFTADIRSEDLLVADLWASTVLSGLSAGDSLDFTLSLAAVPEDDLFYQPSPDGSPSSEVASFLLGAWVDADEDGVADMEEAYVAASMFLLIYCRGAVLPSLEDIGAQDGYNLVELNTDTGSRFSTATPVSDGDTSWEVPANMIHKARGPLSATINPSFSQTATVQLYSVQALLGELDPDDPVAFEMEVEPADAPVDFSIPAPIPDAPTSHFVDVDNEEGAYMDIKMANYKVIAFHDTDGDSAWDEGEDFADSLTAGEESRGLIYIRGTGFLGGLVAERQGASFGWSLYDAAMGSGLDAMTSWSSGVLLDDESDR